MASGVAVQDECLRVYEDIKLRRRYKYVVYRMSEDDKVIIVDQLGEPGATYEEFVGHLKEAEVVHDCRYGVFDFDYLIERTGGTSLTQNKLLFFIWCPDSAKIKRKMLYTSSKSAIRKKLQGIHAEIQCTDQSEVGHDYVLEKVRDRERN
ncbi:PREDICTED: actophorin-like isoform X2 [Priapulus caudatus]|uniref:Actophorin-like isoform X2 n=1 Tax=Priapulus caudatus TaxID=37621 RepID=A0ABM1E8U5_PRICU|nr:PREDICTED: actophorin-like isoform X2 [Priapulus caudatus]